jgi:hypothetical protein
MDISQIIFLTFQVTEILHLFTIMNNKINL